MSTHPLAKAANELCGDSSPQSLRWMADQIRAKRFPARKVRGHWRMSDEDIAVALEVCKNGSRQPEPLEEAGPRVLSFSPASARRVAS
jgi:hypothetical protein